VKTAQRNWIGRSEGAEIDFNVKDSDSKFTVFTTRADTLFGCTYTVLAPEHKLVTEMLESGMISNKDEVSAYIESVKTVSEMDRTKEGKEKTGVRLDGVMAINPANQKEVPIYIADYVLASYGTGAIMAVPAHDERDREFAEKFNIEILDVPFVDVDEVLKNTGGKKVVKYKLREWVFARQRYWGEPFPIVFDENHKSYVVADSELPILLPEVESYEPTGNGESPLADIKSFTDIYGYINDEGEFESVNGMHSERELKTIKYYTDQNQDYFTNTVHEEKDIYADVKSELDYIGDKFKGSRTLEIGSAFCRDAKHLKNKGVDIVCSDISNAFAEVAKENNFEFLNIDPTTSEMGIKVYDNVIALASLLHSENNNLKKIIKKINIATKDGGYIYLRMQNGEGEEFKNNKGGERFFNLVDERGISEILVESGYEVEHVTYSHEDGKTTNKWINVLAKKVSHLEPKLFRRETNTMPQWAGSSWYYLRFLDPHNDNFLIDKNIEKEWPQVDVYVGGDHATRHLIYARFWHKFLFDIGVVSKIEPFERLEFLGFILAEDGRKMSKRWGNIINPDDVVAEYGADTLRLYEMFMAPFEATAVWSTKNIVGVKRFLERVEKIKLKSGEACENKNIIHQTIKKVGEDIENFKFNTAVSQMMICLNEFEKGGLSDDEYEKFMTILAPFAPEIAHEFVGSDWPIYDESKIVSNVATLAIQINGKLRGTLETEMDNSDENIIALLKDSETYKKHITELSLEPKKIIVVKNKIISIVL
jgi:leucyl-tRNA synthetase